MKLPLISIIIPVYNAENFITETIQSCLKQTFKNLEIIVVDDGSTDKSEQMISSIKDSRIRYFKIPNRGPCAARNYGIKMAKGKLLQFLDHDDALHNDKIASQLPYYDRYGDDYLYSGRMGSIVNGSYSSDKGYELYYEDFSPKKYFDVVLNQFGKYLTTGVWLVPRALANKTNGWDERAGLNDDGEFFMRIILHSKGIKFCKNALFYFRRDLATSLSKQFDKKEVYEKWLFSYFSYVKNFEIFFDPATASNLGHAALSVYYCNSYPAYPDLLRVCRNKMRSIGYPNPKPHGMRKFKMIAKVIGTENALKILAIKNILKITT